MRKRFPSVLLSVFFAEMGLLLIVFPWIEIWERNFFTKLSPALSSVMLNYFFRGAVSGLGIVNLWFSLSEILNIGKSITEIEK